MKMNKFTIITYVDIEDVLMELRGSIFAKGDGNLPDSEFLERISVEYKDLLEFQDMLEAYQF
jgi:hypothetical protein